MRRRDALPDPEVDRGLRELEAALAGEPTADPDLSLLAADVAATRPEPDATFLAALDARVHAGFPRPAKVSAIPPWHVRIRQPQVLAPGFIALLAALVVVVGIAASGGGGSDDNASSSARAPAPERADTLGETKSSVMLSAPSAAAKSAPSSSLTPNRKVQRAAALTLTPALEDVQATADGVVRETQAAGGYVQSSDIATRDGSGEASFLLHVPSARLDDTLARLSKLAHVGALDQSAEDVTARTASAADRLADARDERQALLKALGRATTGRQIASLKARLRDNRSEISQRQRALDAERRRADVATVSVTVQGTAKATHDNSGGGAWTPRDALHDAGRVLEVAGGVALIALAVLAPLAVLALLAALAARTTRRRRREAALDRSA